MAKPTGPQQVCNYGSVTLAPGQQFTLPPGSTIIGATDPNAFTSTCPYDPSLIEKPECYIISVTAADNVQTVAGGVITSNWDKDGVTINGLWVGSNYYDFGSQGSGKVGDGGDVFLGFIGGIIDSTPGLKGLLTCVSSNTSTGGQRRGGVGTFCFKTFPSVYKAGISIQVTSNGAGAAGASYPRFPAIPIADYTDSGKCGCGC